MSADKQKPNLKWPASEAGDPPKFLRDGREVIKLPAPADMRKGFYSEDPQRLIKLTGGRLKKFTPPKSANKTSKGK